MSPHVPMFVCTVTQFVHHCHHTEIHNRSFSMSLLSPSFAAIEGLISKILGWYFAGFAFTNKIEVTFTCVTKLHAEICWDLFTWHEPFYLDSLWNAQHWKSWGKLVIIQDSEGFILVSSQVVPIEFNVDSKAQILCFRLHEETSLFLPNSYLISDQQWSHLWVLKSG